MTQRVLVADDDPVARRLILTCLERLSCEIVQAVDGDDACTAFDKHPFALVLCDLNMPNKSGLEVLLHVRASSRPLTPVVLITASHERDARVAGVEAGATDFIEKPFDTRILIARVRHLLDAARIRAEQEMLLNFIAHDLKQPITAITATSSWLLDAGVGDKEQQEGLADMLAAAQRLKLMADDFLTLSKLEHAQMQLKPTALHAADFLAAVERTYRRMAERRGVRLEVECATGTSLAADELLLARLAGNMLENAIRHTKSRVLVRVTDMAQRTELAFCNDGPRVAAADRSKIFERFSQGENGGSAGLGLYFCKLVAEAHGGAVDVSESADWPAVFRVTLPKVLVAQPA